MAISIDQIKPGDRLSGLIIGLNATISQVEWHGDNAVNLIYKDDNGTLGERILFREELHGIDFVEHKSSFTFDGDPNDFKLAAEALRIKYAALYDPLIAVNSSDLQPLPHQIRAVYGELLPKVPLRFLLADDPGAGKTIMAGLYIK